MVAQVRVLAVPPGPGLTGNAAPATPAFGTPNTPGASGNVSSVSGGAQPAGPSLGGAVEPTSVDTLSQQGIAALTGPSSLGGAAPADLAPTNISGVENLSTAGPEFGGSSDPALSQGATNALGGSNISTGATPSAVNSQFSLPEATPSAGPQVAENIPAPETGVASDAVSAPSIPASQGSIGISEASGDITGGTPGVTSTGESFIQAPSSGAGGSTVGGDIGPAPPSPTPVSTAPSVGGGAPHWGHSFVTFNFLYRWRAIGKPGCFWRC